MAAASSAKSSSAHNPPSHLFLLPLVGELSAKPTEGVFSLHRPRRRGIFARPPQGAVQLVEPLVEVGAVLGAQLAAVAVAQAVLLAVDGVQLGAPAPDLVAREPA